MGVLERLRPSSAEEERAPKCEWWNGGKTRLGSLGRLENDRDHTRSLLTQVCWNFNDCGQISSSLACKAKAFVHKLITSKSLRFKEVIYQKKPSTSIASTRRHERHTLSISRMVRGLRAPGSKTRWTSGRIRRSKALATRWSSRHKALRLKRWCRRAEVRRTAWNSSFRHRCGIQKSSIQRLAGCGTARR